MRNEDPRPRDPQGPPKSRKRRASNLPTDPNELLKRLDRACERVGIKAAKFEQMGAHPDAVAMYIAQTLEGVSDDTKVEFLVLVAEMLPAENRVQVISNMFETLSPEEMQYVIRAIEQEQKKRPPEGPPPGDLEPPVSQPEPRRTPKSKKPKK